MYDQLDSDFKEAIIRLAKEKTDIKFRVDRLEVMINELPDKIFNTKVKVKNGKEEELSFIDLSIQNWARTSKLQKDLNDGSILIPITDSNNKLSYQKLSDILSTLYLRPSSWFNKTSKISDGLIKIGKVLFGISLIGYIIYTLIKGGGL